MNIISQRGNSSFLVEIRENELYALLDVSMPNVKPLYASTPDRFYRFGWFTQYEPNPEIERMVESILWRFKDEETK